jgi:hypothetical protein
MTDLPLLELVGHPHAINPERELRGIAEQRGWPILEFRRRVTLAKRLTLREESPGDTEHGTQREQPNTAPDPELL